MIGMNTKTQKLKRINQRLNADVYHHPVEKLSQLSELTPYVKGDILEVFAGQGNLTPWYKEQGSVTALTRDTTGDSFHYIYELRAKRKKYDWIDIDSYGYPDRFFPLIFEMMNDVCGLVFTFPQVACTCLNGMREQRFSNFYNNPTPSIGDVVGKITDWALREWFLVSLLDVKKIKRIYRIAFICKRVNVHKMTNVKSRWDKKEGEVCTKT